MIAWVLIILAAACNAIDSKDVVFVKPEMTARGLPTYPSPHAPLFVAIAISDLAPRSTYEVCVSYPATSPATFVLEFIGTDSRPNVAGARRLLNTQLVTFGTENPPPVIHIDGIASHVLSIVVVPEGVPATAEVAEIAAGAHMIDVTVSKKIVGIPRRALPVIICSVFLMLAAIAIGSVALPRFRPLRRLLALDGKRDD